MSYGSPYPEPPKGGAFSPGGVSSFGMPSDDEKMWAMFAHLSPLVLGFLGPLIIWLVKKDSPFVEDQAKEALNFQLAALIVNLLIAITCVGPIIVLVVAIIFSVIGAMEANKGVTYRYPYTFRLIN